MTKRAVRLPTLGALTALILGISPLLRGQAAAGAEPGAAFAAASATFSRPPALALSATARPASDAHEAETIRRLVAALAKIDRPDFGLSNTLTGESFAPIPGTGRAGVFILGAPKPEPAPEFVELVKLGPKALPFLLEALEDATPTRLTLAPPAMRNGLGWMGGAYRLNEISGNPANPREREVLGSRVLERAPDLPRKQLNDPRHVVTVGDICFVIIGQITGRPSYRVARYQPTAISIYNSPTDDPQLVKEIRAIWASSDPAQALLDSLLLDLFLEAEPPPEDDSRAAQALRLAQWSYPKSAAMRLLYYFPKETAELVAGRLEQRIDDTSFIEAVAWSEAQPVRDRLRRLFRESPNVEIALACLPAVPETENEQAQARLAELLAATADAPDAAQRGPYDESYHLLLAASKRFGPAAKPLFLRYRERDTLNRRVALCSALRLHPEWAVEFLAPFLDDRRELKLWYPIDPDKPDGDRLAIRMCDHAAQRIAESRPELNFRLGGTHAELDAQIAELKRRLAASAAETAETAQSSLPGS